MQTDPSSAFTRRRGKWLQPWEKCSARHLSGARKGQLNTGTTPLWAKSFLIPWHPWLCFSCNTHCKKSPAGSLTFGEFLRQANTAQLPKSKDVLQKHYECKEGKGWLLFYLYLQLYLGTPWILLVCMCCFGSFFFNRILAGTQIAGRTLPSSKDGRESFSSCLHKLLQIRSARGF